MDEQIPEAVATAPDPSIETRLEVATYLLARATWMWSTEQEPDAWDNEALPLSVYEEAIAQAEQLIRDRSRCINGCEITRDNVVRADAYCDGCHEYGSEG